MLSSDWSVATCWFTCGLNQLMRTTKQTRGGENSVIERSRCIIEPLRTLSFEETTSRWRKGKWCINSMIYLRQLTSNADVLVTLVFFWRMTSESCRLRWIFISLHPTAPGTSGSQIGTCWSNPKSHVREDASVWELNKKFGTKASNWEIEIL